jgi:hypothetical protein
MVRMAFVVLFRTPPPRHRLDKHTSVLTTTTCCVSAARIKDPAASNKFDALACVLELSTVLASISPENRCVFLRVFEMIAELQQNEESNRMSAVALAYVTMQPDHLPD